MSSDHRHRGANNDEDGNADQERFYDSESALPNH